MIHGLDTRATLAQGGFVGGTALGFAIVHRKVALGLVYLKTSRDLSSGTGGFLNFMARCYQDLDSRVTCSARIERVNSSSLTTVRSVRYSI